MDINSRSRLQEAYKTYLTRSLGLDPNQSDEAYSIEALASSEIEKIRRLLTKSSEIVFYFWRLFSEENAFNKKEKDQIAINRLTALIPMEQSVLFNACFYRSMRRAQSLINLEGWTRQAVPIVLLTRLSQGALSDLEKEALRQWIEKLNAEKNQLTLIEFEEALTEIISLMSLTVEDKEKAEALVLKLGEWNCLFLTREDSSHLQWRRGLRPGDHITCNQRELLVGPQLSPEKDIQDRFQIFALANHEHERSIIKIGDNRMRLKIEKSKMDLSNQTLQSIERKDWYVKWIEIDSRGSCAVLEKLDRCLFEYPWQSLMNPLEPKEEEILYLIAKTIHSLCVAKKSPKFFDLKQLMIDERGEMKALRVLEMEWFNYNNLERFCIELSNGNRFVKDYVMTRSRLKDHPVATRFYREALSHLIKTGRTSRLTQLQPVGYENSLYENSLKKLSQDLLALRERCVERAKSRLQRERLYEEDQEDSLKKEVLAILLSVYQNSTTPGVLDGLEEDTLKEFRKLKNEKKQLSDLPFFSKLGKTLGDFLKIG